MVREAAMNALYDLTRRLERAETLDVSQSHSPPLWAEQFGRLRYGT